MARHQIKGSIYPLQPQVDKKQMVIGSVQTGGQVLFKRGDKMSFSEKLQKLRKDKGLSQEQLAELLNVSRQAVSKWESGQTYPEIDKLIKLSDLFNVTLDELVRDRNTENNSNIQDGNKESDEYRESDEEDDDDDWISVGGFTIGVAIGLITGDFMWMAGGGFLGIGISYIIKGVKRKV